MAGGTQKKRTKMLINIILKNKEVLRKKKYNQEKRRVKECISSKIEGRQALSINHLKKKKFLKEKQKGGGEDINK